MGVVLNWDEVLRDWDEVVLSCWVEHHVQRCYALFRVMQPAFELAPPRASDSAAEAYLRQLLLLALPGLDIVAIARRPGVLSKVAITGSVGADVIAAVRGQLDGERIEVVPYSAEPGIFIGAALGLAERPPMVLLPSIGHARVWLGEIDLRGMDGWRGINRLLASAVTGWRIRLLPIASSAAWQVLARAHADRRAVLATVVQPGRVNVHGLFARLANATEIGQDFEVRIVRMDADEGRIVVSRQLASTGQLALFSG